MAVAWIQSLATTDVPEPDTAVTEHEREDRWPAKVVTTVAARPYYNTDHVTMGGRACPHANPLPYKDQYLSATSGITTVCPGVWGTCAVCGLEIGVLRDGTLPVHAAIRYEDGGKERAITGGQLAEYHVAACAGSGKGPASERQAERWHEIGSKSRASSSGVMGWVGASIGW